MVEHPLMRQFDGAEPEDQVPRKLAWERQHPDGPRIAPPCEHDPLWRAKLRDGTVEVKALDLWLLLDELDKLEADDNHD